MIPETDPETGATCVTLRFDRNSDPWFAAYHGRPFDDLPEVLKRKDFVQPLKRYALFSWEDEPLGGWDDFDDDFDTLEEVGWWLDLNKPFNWHIVDMSTGAKADEGSNYIGPPMEIKGDQ